MIIECINCSKKFTVNSDLIPSTGRTIQCGSCNHVWFFDPNNLISKGRKKTKTEKKIPITNLISENKKPKTKPTGTFICKVKNTIQIVLHNQHHLSLEVFYPASKISHHY